MRKCPVCEEGDLVEKSSRRICHGIEVTELYSVCTVCKSEICNSDQTNKNHQVAKDAGCYETETFKKFKYGE